LSNIRGTNKKIKKFAFDEQGVGLLGCPMYELRDRESVCGGKQDNRKEAEGREKGHQTKLTLCRNLHVELELKEAQIIKLSDANQDVDTTLSNKYVPTLPPLFLPYILQGQYIFAQYILIHFSKQPSLFIGTKKSLISNKPLS
jgi:hypothetical protein